VTLLGHALLFFLAAFTGFLMKADRDSLFSICTLIAVPVAGVYFLGWWAVLTFLIGAIYGGKVFGESIKGGRDRAKD